MKQSVVPRNPDIMGGTPVFVGTRVPIQTLLDYLEAGDSIDEFLEENPDVDDDLGAEFVSLRERALAWA